MPTGGGELEIARGNDMKRALFLVMIMTVGVAAGFSEIVPPLDLLGTWNYRVLIGTYIPDTDAKPFTWRYNGYLAAEEYEKYKTFALLSKEHLARQGPISPVYKFLPDGFGSLGNRPFIWEWESNAHLIVVLRDSKTRFTFSSVEEGVWIVFVEDLNLRAHQTRSITFEIGIFERVE